MDRVGLEGVREKIVTWFKPRRNHNRVARNFLLTNPHAISHKTLQIMGPDAAIVARCMRGCLRDLDALAHAKRGQRRPYERVEEQGLQMQFQNAREKVSAPGGSIPVK